MESEDKANSAEAGAPKQGEGKAVMISPVNEKEQTETERNAVFNNLVHEDGDIVGLVAYSIYKQNKVDWLAAFEKALGRGPGEVELNAYIIGENTPRRLAIYRHLAGATLAGNGPNDVPESAWLDASGGVRRPGKQDVGSGWIVSSVVSYAILAAAILIGVWLVARYGLPASRP